MSLAQSGVLTLRGAPHPALLAVRRHAIVVALALAALLLTAASFLPWRQVAEPARMRGRILVLPVEVTDGSGAMAWARLGLMDLIALRLRAHGLTVPPSESVLAALAAPGQSAGTLRPQGLHAQMLVQPRLLRLDAGWQLSLELRRADGNDLTLQQQRPDILEAAAAAADALPARLGRPAAARGELADETAWRIRAGLLGNELDSTRAWLDSLPAAARSGREARYLDAELDYRAGRLEASRATLDTLLAEPPGEDTVFRGRLLVARGSLAMRLHDDAAGMQDFAAAVAALEAAGAPRELGRALMGRGGMALRQLRLDEAARDLQRARSLLDSVGDDLGVARAEVNLALLQRRQGHPLQALEQLQAAALRFADYAAVNELSATLAGVIDLQCALLRWEDALASSERAQPLLARLSDHHLRARLLQARADVLLGLGRLSAAQQVLDEIAALGPGAAHQQARSQLLAAQLAFARGEPQRAVALARPLLSGQAGDSLGDLAGSAALLLQRAQPVLPRERIDIDAALAVGDRDDTSALLARGLNLQFQHQPDAAEALLRDALQQAQDSRDLRDQRDATEAIAGLLLSDGRAAEVLAMAAPLAVHASRDFDTALLFARLRREQAGGEDWRLARQSAAALAGERPLPATLDLPRSATPALLRAYRKAE
jgi:hypothetical protein